MEDIHQKNISYWLGRFEFVRWDRFIELQESYCIYGWIDREKDNYKDFLFIEYSKKEKTIVFWLSSSATFDHKIIELLMHPETLALALNNAKCKRVEDFFDVKGAIKLKKK